MKGPEVIAAHVLLAHALMDEVDALDAREHRLFGSGGGNSSNLGAAAGWRGPSRSRVPHQLVLERRERERQLSAIFGHLPPMSVSAGLKLGAAGRLPQVVLQ